MSEKDNLTTDFSEENDAEQVIAEEGQLEPTMENEAPAEVMAADEDPEPEKPVPMKKKPQTKKKKGKKKKKKGKKAKARRKKKIATGVFIALLICLIAVFGWIGYVSAYIFPLVFGDLGPEDTPAAPITEEQKDAFASGQMVVTLLGSDGRDGLDGARSDTLMVAFVDLDKEQIRLLSIPRDTYVTIPTTGERTKINAAYAYGGVELADETLEENFGITSDYYMDVNFQGFISMIDALGGLTIDVPMRMYYPDEGIDLDAGVQELDGTDALAFCRFRSDGQGDLGRVDRQQAFLVALKDKMFSAGTLLKIPELCSAVLANIETDFSGTQLLQIMLALKNGFDFQTYQPDGEARYQDEISYVFINDNGQRLIDALIAFGDIPTDITATTNDLDLSADSAAEDTSETTEDTTTEEE